MYGNNLYATALYGSEVYIETGVPTVDELIFDPGLPTWGDNG